MQIRAYTLAALAAGFVSVAAYAQQPADPNAKIIDIANAIMSACPSRDAARGIPSRDACADSLGKMGVLASAMSDENGVVWGGTKDQQFDPSKDKLTRLDALVWRKLYLSLFAFDGTYKIQDMPNGDKLLRLDSKIRPIPPEEFPYPFWHSAAKWQDYQQNKQVGLLFRNGVLIAAYRNAELDPTLPINAKQWDGKWTWDVNGQPGPRVALYTYSLSHDNPARADLETAYRDFEAAARPYYCTSCHNPANPKSITPLIFFTHPSQALVARHDIVKALEDNRMPPPDGIADNDQRQKLLELAKRFADQGDRALAYEKTQLK